MEQQKVYLKTIEEVSDALAAGKVVYNKFGTYFRKDKNGFLISSGEDKTFSLNSTVFIPQDTPLYILEPKPLEVKLWHLYEDKKGDKVLIIGRYIDDVPYPFYGIMENAYRFIFYNKNGKSWESNNHYDLVKELADLSKYFEKEPKDEKND